MRWTVRVAAMATTTMLATAAANGGPSAASVERQERQQDRARPNVVVVMADDMRADDLRFMPHVRRLVAARGLTYANAFSPYPLCCPARASFLTGQYAHNHHVLDNEAPYGFGGFDDSATVATALRGAGYRTAFVGKYLNDYGLVPSRVTGEPSATFVPAGWDDWHGLLQVPYPVGAGTYHYFHPVLNNNGRVASYEGRYQTTLLGQVAREVVRDAAGDRPFFMYLSTLAPHDGLPHEPDDVDFVLRDNGTEAWFPTAGAPRVGARPRRRAGRPQPGHPGFGTARGRRLRQAPIGADAAAERRRDRGGGPGHPAARRVVVRARPRGRAARRHPA